MARDLDQATEGEAHEPIFEGLSRGDCRAVVGSCVAEPKIQ